MTGPTLYLVRHGLTEWNRQGRYQGHKDIPLDAVGRQQARSVARALAGVQLEAIYASDLLRARQTAEPLALEHGLKVACLPGLREMHFGDWEGLTRDEVHELYPEVVRTWYSDRARAGVPGGETVAVFAERVLAAFEVVVGRHPRGSVAVISHGGSLRVYLCSVLGMDLSRLWTVQQDSACISVVDYEPAGPRLLRLNCTEHLREAGA
ncbi:MAG: alpha-ribazole phosphatase [bacterium]|nr:alpha-ribazole phosphatase [bacterium]